MLAPLTLLPVIFMSSQSELHPGYEDVLLCMRKCVRAGVCVCVRVCESMAMSMCWKMFA